MYICLCEIEKHPERDKQIRQLYAKKKSFGEIVLYLYIIDAQRKLSGSRK